MSMAPHAEYAADPRLLRDAVPASTPYLRVEYQQLVPMPHTAGKEPTAL
jgi:hypothetical protein